MLLPIMFPALEITDPLLRNVGGAEAPTGNAARHDLFRHAQSGLPPLLQGQSNSFVGQVATRHHFKEKWRTVRRCPRAATAKRAGRLRRGWPGPGDRHAPRQSRAPAPAPGRSPTAWSNKTAAAPAPARCGSCPRSEEHTSELQSRGHLVCRLLLEKKKRTKPKTNT